MDMLNERLKNPVISLAIGAAAGLILGLLIGYVFAPVQWTDAAPSHLRADLQADYLRTAIDSFSRTGNIGEAQRRWLELGDAADSALAAVEGEPTHLTPTELEAFKIAVSATGPVGGGEETPAAEDGGFPFIVWVGCIVTLVIGMLIVFTFLFRRGPVSEGDTAAMQAAEASRQAEQTDYEAIGESPPLSQFMTTFMLGDDLFDDSFSIDSPAGEFLGECGVGIAETSGPGEPKRVTAFEVWLFDKNDIQTVTKVLMSEYAFHDVETHERLSAKGDPVLAQPDSQVVLETAKLRLVARVVDMSYGDDPTMSSNSHFERMTLELAVWPI
jgi:hypothetical protein